MERVGQVCAHDFDLLCCNHTPRRSLEFQFHPNFKQFKVWNLIITTRRYQRTSACQKREKSSTARDADTRAVIGLVRNLRPPINVMEFGEMRGGVREACHDEAHAQVCWIELQVSPEENRECLIKRKVTGCQLTMNFVIVARRYFKCPSKVYSNAIYSRRPAKISRSGMTNWSRW